MPPGKSRGRLVLMLAAFPRRSETFIVSKFVHLWKSGWDVHIVTQRFDRRLWGQFPELVAHPQLTKRIRLAPPTRPLWKVPLHMAVRFLWLVLRHPVRTLRYIARGWPEWKLRTWKHLYLDAPLVALAPDIVHFEFGAIAMERLHITRQFDCKLTASFRGYDISYVGLPDRWYYRPLWEVADGVHFLGRDLLQRAIRRGFPAEKIHHRLIPPALDIRKFPDHEKTPSRPPERLRIVSVGRLEWKKGYEYAFMAMHRLKAAGIPFEWRIVGTGKMAQCLYLMRHQLDMEEEVRMMGGMPHAAVIKQLEWAEVLVHASVSEGFCNAVQEAQAMQVVPVVSDAEGLPENVADGVTGYVVPRRAPQAMAEKVAHLYRHPELRQEMGRAGRERVKRLFTIDRQVQAFDRFYREVLHGRTAE